MKANSFLSQFRNFLGVLIVFGVLIFALNFVYNLVFKPAVSSETSNLGINKVETNFDISNLSSEKFYSLSEANIINEATQIKGVSYSQEDPLPPSNISVLDAKTGREIVIFWDKPESPAGFIRIYRSEKSSDEGELVADNLPLTGKFSDTKVKNEITYYYTIRSVNIVGGQEFESKNSNNFIGISSDVEAPLPPENLVVQSTGKSGELELSWENPLAEDFSLVRIYRSEVKGELGEFVGQTEGESYLDNALVDGVEYYYTITALDTSQNESTRTFSVDGIGNDSPFSSPSSVNSNTNASS